jgi:hypothetical protein
MLNFECFKDALSFKKREDTITIEEFKTMIRIKELLSTKFEGGE